MQVDDSILYAKQCAEKNFPVVLFGSYSWNRLDSADEGRFGGKYIHRVDSWAAVASVVDAVYNESIAVESIFSRVGQTSAGVTIAAIQMCSTNDKDANIKTIQRLCSAAVEKGATFIALPECCLYMGQSAAETAANAEDLTKSKYLDLLTDIAVSQHVFLSIGAHREAWDCL